MPQGREFFPEQVMETCPSRPEEREKCLSTNLLDLSELLIFIITLLESCHF
jgi:hypothetical protein